MAAIGERIPVRPVGTVRPIRPESALDSRVREPKSLEDRLKERPKLSEDDRAVRLLLERAERAVRESSVGGLLLEHEQWDAYTNLVVEVYNDLSNRQ